jgi:ribosomal-protein-alanine N-acetyltransferase
MLPCAILLMQNPELFNYLHMGVLSLDEYKGLFNWLRDSYNTPFNKPFKYSFAVQSKKTGAFIGWCGVGVLDMIAPDKELYYLIGRDYWGNGYGTEAAAALTAYAFDVIGLESLYAKADPRNKGSLKIIEKLGFGFDRVLEGLEGEDEECNGEWMHVLTREQYDQQKVV